MLSHTLPAQFGTAPPQFNPRVAPNIDGNWQDIRNVPTSIGNPKKQDAIEAIARAGRCGPQQPLESYVNEIRVTKARRAGIPDVISRMGRTQVMRKSAKISRRMGRSQVYDIHGDGSDAGSGPETSAPASDAHRNSRGTFVR